MRTVAYVRVSTGGQDLASQRLASLDYAHRQGLTVETFVEAHSSSRRPPGARGLDTLLEQLHPGNVLLVSELSRLGRSVGQIIQLVDRLIQQRVRLIVIKENLQLNGPQDMQTKVMVTLLSLFAEIEREVIAERTKEGLAAAGQAQRRPRDVEAHGPGGRDSNLLGQNGLESGDRQNSRRLPLHAPPLHPAQTPGLTRQGAWRTRAVRPATRPGMESPPMTFEEDVRVKARYRRAALTMLALLLATGCVHREAVQVENASRPTLCAEEDNIYVKFVGAGARRLTVEAVHPVYIHQIIRDSTAPDFTDCPDMRQNRSYAFTPKIVTLYEDADYALVGRTFSQFWRPERVDFHVDTVVTHDLHLVQLIRKIGGRRIEILVVYPSDGYWRAKPLPPPHLVDTAYGSSFLIGPVEEDDRPFVPLSSIRFTRSDLSFQLRFRQGEGLLRVLEASPEKTRLEISLPPLPGGTAFAALRSMFVWPLIADTAEVQLTSRWGNRRNWPVMDFTSGNATSVTFGRRTPSCHNTSAPDLRFEAFTR